MNKLIVVLSFASLLHAQIASTPASKHSAGRIALPPMPKVTQPTAVIDTTAGRMQCTLYPDKAPKSVQNFAELAEGTKPWKDPKTDKTMHKPLYNGTIFHRVIPNFMIQGGDPLGTGEGGPGYEMKDEFSPDLNFEQPGMLAYANSGPNTNGSQFFITEVPTPHLNPCLDAAGCDRGGQHVPQGYGYTIFGKCDASTVALVKDIARRARDERNDRPYDPVVIQKITILDYKTSPVTKHTVHRRAKPAAK
jgi:peptidyl-prolyl cis-trans isomerase A (cyclophilin A)